MIPGFKKSECITVVEINKNTFYPGDQVKIKIDCDNTSSSIPIKSFKFKLHRKCMGIVNSEQYGQLRIRKFEYLETMQIPKLCPANFRMIETFDFKIPSKEILAADCPMSNVLSASISGKNMEILYYLRVFVKHDGLMVSLGEGQCIVFPIRI